VALTAAQAGAFSKAARTSLIGIVCIELFEYFPDSHTWSCMVWCLHRAMITAQLPIEDIEGSRMTKQNIPLSVSEQPEPQQRVVKFMPNLTGEGVNRLLGLPAAPDPTMEEACEAILRILKRQDAADA
jgi:hypothetical protein